MEKTLLANNTAPEVTLAIGFRVFSVTMAVLAVGLLSVTPTLADLEHYGPNDEYFYDTAQQLYWMDPNELVGMSKSEIQAFVNGSPIWKLASYTEVNGLVGQKSIDGNPLIFTMGPAQRTVTGGDRWVGFFDEASPHFSPVY